MGQIIPAPLKPRLHDTTGCQTGYTTGLTTGCIVYTNVYPVIKPVSCKRGFTYHFNTHIFIHQKIGSNVSLSCSISNCLYNFPAKHVSRLTFVTPTTGKSCVNIPDVFARVRSRWDSSIAPGRRYLRQPTDENGALLTCHCRGSLNTAVSGYLSSDVSQRSPSFP